MTSIATEVVFTRPRCGHDLAPDLPHQLFQFVAVILALDYLDNFDKLSEACFKSNYTVATLNVEHEQLVAEVDVTLDTNYLLDRVPEAAR